MPPRSALIRFLKEYPSLEVVGEATDGEDAIRRAEELRPAILLMDTNMPKLDGIAATRRLKAHYKEITVIGAFGSCGPGLRGGNDERWSHGASIKGKRYRGFVQCYSAGDGSEKPPLNKQ